MTTRPRLARLVVSPLRSLPPRRSVAPRAFAADPPARVQTVAVLPPTGDNIDPGLLRAARDILKDHL